MAGIGHPQAQETEWNTVTLDVASRHDGSRRSCERHDNNGAVGNCFGLFLKQKRHPGLPYKAAGIREPGNAIHG